MDIWIHTTTTEAIVLIGRIHYYWYMWIIRLYLLDTLVYVYIEFKIRIILWNDELEISLKELK